MTGNRGDDLEENFVLDETIGLESEASDREQPALSASRGASRNPSESDALPSKSKRLKEDARISVEPEDATAAKKRKRKERSKENKAKKRRLNSDVLSASELERPAFLPPLKAAVFLTACRSRATPVISSVELEELEIPESSIIDTTRYPHRNLDSLPEFIRQITPELHAQCARLPEKNSKSVNGAPILLILAGAAMRVADIVRTCKPLRGKKGGEIAKLFAKHIKLTEQAEQLRQSGINIGAGTPDRVGKLLADGALRTDALTHMLLDLSHRDVKQRNLLEIPETRKELFGSIWYKTSNFSDADSKDRNESILSRLQNGKTKLILF